MSFIKTEVKDFIGTICFNNDEKRNSLSTALMEEFYRCTRHDGNEEGEGDHPSC